MLITKCILAPKEKEDGLRISVMSRHTLEDGKTPDTRITAGSFDLHRPELAPSPKLIGAYYRGEISWDEYEVRFRRKLHRPKVRAHLVELAMLSLWGNVTLLCIESTFLHCHRRLIAKECQRLVPGIIVQHIVFFAP